MTERISKYEVVERIAEGGFGVVYKARDPYLKRTVAVKTCTFSDTESRQRFFREAQLAARFDHPNVTRVHDFGVENDQAFLVQEYLTGEDLLPKIQRRDRIPLHTKLEYLLQAARGLRYAHGRGVIHRDIKPGNIRVLESGEVKILDFGIAKPLGGSALTQQGMTVGTLGYLSPEQIEGKELDLRTDIFSFGVVAYELIGYTSPFSGRDVSGMLRSILGDSPRRLEELVPDCPEDVANIVHRCLRRERDERYDDFEALLREMERSNRAIDPNLITGITAQEDLPPVEQADTKPAAVTSENEVPPGSESPDKAVAPEPEKGNVLVIPSEGEPVEVTEETRETRREATSTAPTSVLGQADEVDDDGTPPSEATPSEVTEAAPAWVPPPPLEVPRAPSRTALPAMEPDPAPSASAPQPPSQPPARAQMPTPASAPASQEPASKPTISGGNRRSLFVVGGVVAALLLVVLVWALKPKSDEPIPVVTPPVTQAVEPEPVATAPVTAPVLVVAGPWAEIADILDAQGNSVPSPAKGEVTPKRVELSPGFYTIVLRHPEIPEVAVCQVNASPGVPATCQAEMLDVDVTGYFKETGWWN